MPLNDTDTPENQRVTTQSRPFSYEAGQWRPGRLLVSLAVMIAIIVIAAFFTR